MKTYPFKKHAIVRSNVSHKSPYRMYRTDLQKDFMGRCCYCNMSDELITTSFHIDHFIPRKEFEGKKNSLLEDYNNLMWACPKCNLSKKDQYSGDIMSTNKIENGLFYNPVEVDYNSIFYRDNRGVICSDDEKGKQMIKALKLYRPVHRIGWLVERLEKAENMLKIQVDTATDKKKQEDYKEIHRLVASKTVEYEQLLRAFYKGKKFDEIDG